MSTQAMNQFQATAPPDLISFDSWEESANNRPPLCAVSPTFTDEYGSVNSFDEENLAVPEISKSGVAVEDKNNTVHVVVSGTHFSVDHDVFSKLKNLPWENSPDGSMQTLGTSAGLFEIVLNFLLFKTLPDARSISSVEKEELEVMALQLGLTELASHATARSSFRSRRRTSSTTSQLSDAALSVPGSEPGVPDSPRSNKDKKLLPNMKLSSFRNRRRTSSTTSLKSDSLAVAKEVSTCESPRLNARKFFRRSSSKDPSTNARDTTESTLDESSADASTGKDQVIEETEPQGLGRKTMFSLPKRLSISRGSGNQRQLNQQEIQEIRESYSDLIN